MELLILPYDSAVGNSLLGRLIRELSEGGWERFRAAVAFVKLSGNVIELLEALATFAERGGDLALTFGAGDFGPEGAEGSDYAAIDMLVRDLGSYPHVRVSLYKEVGRTFHPKVYLFDQESKKRALLIVGSSNWSRGGLFENVEVSIALPLDLRREEHLTIYTKITRHFQDYWIAHE